MPFDGSQLGRYNLSRLLATGGMGEVYLGEDARLGRQVAIKIIKSDLTPHSDAKAAADANRLFLREAKAIAALQHPHILALFDFGDAVIQGNSISYMVMPYCQEGSLDKWLQKRGSTNLPSLQHVASLLEQAADALQHAHQKDIIHQDVKPQNFLIERWKSVDLPDLLLTDFGIAKLLSSQSNTSQSIRGTPLYMAPEQWEGHPVPATDQYALATMVYQWLTGHSPFQGNPGRIMYQHLTVQPRPPSALQSGIPAAVDTVVLKALMKKPQERFETVLAFAQAFQQALSGPVLPLEVQQQPTQRNDFNLTPTLTQQEVVGRLRSEDLPKVLERFRKAITSSEIPKIIAAFEPDLKPYLNAQEDKIVELALGFDKAYSNGNDVALLQAHQVLKQYYTSPLYTQEQVDRIRLARQRAQQPLSGNLPVVNGQNPISPAVGNVFSPPPMGSVQNPAPRPADMPPQGALWAPATYEQVAATVKGIDISTQWLDLAEAVQREYLSYRLSDLQRRIRDLWMMATCTPSQKQELKQAKQEVTKIHKLFNDAMEQRKNALDNLIDNVLLKEWINALQTSLPAWYNYINTGVQNDVALAYEKVGFILLQSNLFMGLKDSEAIDAVKTILRVFVRRYYFDKYLHRVEGTTLEQWLKWQKEQEKDNIVIEYEQARIPAPRGMKKIVDALKNPFNVY